MNPLARGTVLVSRSSLDTGRAIAMGPAAECTQVAKDIRAAQAAGNRADISRQALLYREFVI